MQDDEVAGAGRPWTADEELLAGGIQQQLPRGGSDGLCISLPLPGNFLPQTGRASSTEKSTSL